MSLTTAAILLTAIFLFLGICILIGMLMLSAISGLGGKISDLNDIDLDDTK